MSQGGTCSAHDREVRCIFLGLKIYTLRIFGSRDLSGIFFGLKVCLIEWISIEVLAPVFFLGRKFWCQVIFLSVKFQDHVYFGVRNMKLRRTPRHVYCKYPLGLMFSIQQSPFCSTTMITLYLFQLSFTKWSWVSLSPFNLMASTQCCQAFFSCTLSLKYLSSRLMSLISN